MIDDKSSPALLTPTPAPAPMWQAVSDPVPVPDTSMLPPADETALAGGDMLQRVAQEAHATIDRLADGVAPAVRQLEEGVSSAEGALQATTDQIRETRDAWSASLRTAVRKNPLAFLVGAVAVGALISRIRR